MDPLELTAEGRLLRRRKVETPEGLRPEVKDFTEEAHQLLTRTVEFGEGVTLGSLFELLKACPFLVDMQAANWAAAYLERYEAIRRGEISPKPTPRGEGAPAIEALALSLHQEVELPRTLWEQVVQAHAAPTPSFKRLDGESCESQLAHKPVVTYRRWEVSGLAYPFEKDTTFSGKDFKAGQRLHYAMSLSFDQTAIDLPLRVLPGSITLDVKGKKSREYSVVTLPVGTQDEPPKITLYELIEGILFEFSFHGGPEDAEEMGEELDRQADELDDESHFDDLAYASSAVFCPYQFAGDLAEELSDTERFWSRERVLASTGWSETELETRCRKGRLMELSAGATDTRPRRKAFPQAQFAPTFDVELFYYLNWVASCSCSDWSVHRFLQAWPNPLPSDDSEGAAPMLKPVAEGTNEETLAKNLAQNGWEVLCTPGEAIDHEAITDPVIKGHARKTEPLRPVFPEGSAKRALVEGFEAFAADCRRRYEES
jgi:hypothetical protein